MGKSCPTMNEAIEQVGLDGILKGFMLETKSRNLEDIYSELFRRGDECKNARIAMEKKLYEYFSNVQLPSFLTIYDLLILSLTEKDCIVSFNWDSLLIQAYNRVAKITRNRPEILFLHGNVGAGVCKDCMTFGLIQNYCRKCGKPYNVVPLLYPVEQKDYNSDIFIRDQLTPPVAAASDGALPTFFQPPRRLWTRFRRVWAESFLPCRVCLSPSSATCPSG